MGIKAYRNLSQIVTLKNAWQKDGRRLKPEDLSIISNGAVIFSNKEILWVGEEEHIPEQYAGLKGINGEGKVLVPELVDSHTHLIFGGDRAHEYTMRLNGADYEAIGKAGGGILNTMNGTNAMNAEALFKLCCERVDRLHSYGVGTIEVKSGYGLNFEKEYEMTKVIDRLKKHYAGKVQIINTYMAAHAIPKSFKSSEEFMDQVVMPLMEKLHAEGLIDVVDIFHEQGYFSETDTIKLLSRAKELGIARKTHADEFHDNKGAILAANYGALSTDHLLRTSDDGIEALAKSKTVATLLPGTGFFLGKEQAKARKFLDAGVKVAIASDYNPGSCHCDNLLLTASLAAPQYKMNVAELWAAITMNAAAAVGLTKQGAIIEGLAPRFTLFNVDRLDVITYHWGRNFAVSETL